MEQNGVRRVLAKLDGSTARDSHDKTLRNRLFLKRLLSTEKRILFYMLNLAHSFSDAEEIMEEASTYKEASPHTSETSGYEDGRVDR